MKKKFVLGIDTSNYKTSIAVIEGNEIIYDLRRFLRVKEGERGLRQSEALFQHIQNLPDMLAEIFSKFRGDISAVAYSSRPRPVKGSYMPCFLAGQNSAVAIASALRVPCKAFSHQEGHIEAVRKSCGCKFQDEFIACHFSGGTCEVLKVRDICGKEALYNIDITGGSKDISFGQVIDRAGVAMKFQFPCGEELDEIANNSKQSSELLTPIKVVNGELHLSGFDTQIRNSIGRADRDDLVREMFEKISDSIIKMVIQACRKEKIYKVIMTGGVSMSKFIRRRISDELTTSGVDVCFDDSNMSSDNAVGTAFLGRRCLWG